MFSQITCYAVQVLFIASRPDRQSDELSYSGSRSGEAAGRLAIEQLEVRSILSIGPQLDSRPAPSPEEPMNGVKHAASERCDRLSPLLARPVIGSKGGSPRRVRCARMWKSSPVRSRAALHVDRFAARPNPVARVGLRLKRGVCRLSRAFAALSLSLGRRRSLRLVRRRSLPKTWTPLVARSARRPTAAFFPAARIMIPSIPRKAPVFTRNKSPDSSWASIEGRATKSWRTS